MFSGAPGPHAVSQGVLEIWSLLVEGIGASPKHDHPLPPWSALSAAEARFGGTRNKIAWWTSLVPGKNWLATMYALVLMCGLIKVQW